METKYTRKEIIYQPYPRPNRALVKALYASLRAHEIDLETFSACLRMVMGAHWR